MYGQNNEMPGFQANPNNYDECERCGKPLQSKSERDLNLCKECQRRQEDHKVESTDNE
ncbi:hypothetical protein SAMN04487936_1217 [Halobacillus dabanensis]|uniref:Uncharacterized protein n=1 Tax=Halobacillus dabanensis TaxID=240302 RepID=A0A1I4AVR8_HALDA|nr:hypothetical protein [Halobacillus dabanensis]SFK59736.1 hypothetical protein SAMN04487936_1217 [Halobacillus dabanensis]